MMRGLITGDLLLGDIIWEMVIAFGVIFFA